MSYTHTHTHLLCITHSCSFARDAAIIHTLIHSLLLSTPHHCHAQTIWSSTRLLPEKGRTLQETPSSSTLRPRWAVQRWFLCELHVASSPRFTLPLYPLEMSVHCHLHSHNIEHNHTVTMLNDSCQLPQPHTHLVLSYLRGPTRLL